MPYLKLNHQELRPKSGFVIHALVINGDLSEMCLSSTDLVEFTDEEGYGRYLDLHDCYLKCINLKGAEVTTP